LSSHQALDRATRDGTPFAAELAEDLVGTVDLHIGVPDPLDLGTKTSSR